MTSLTVLSLWNNRLADVTALAELTLLTELHLHNNEIADVTPLAELTRLESLGFGDNEVVDVSPLTELGSLGWLGLWNNDLEDIGPLLDNAGLGAGDIVHVWRNPLNEFSRAQDIPTLEDREVRVIHTSHDVPFLPIAADAQRQGFVRIVNKTPSGGLLRVWNHAVDDTGDSRGASDIFLWSVQSASHFNSGDLEVGNAEKGISQGVGAGEGGWRLELYPDNPEPDVEVSAYMRTKDGFLTAMNALAPETSDGYRIAFFNPGSNLAQVSTLRLANPGYGTANVTISGVDDLGVASAGSVEVTMDAGEARMLTTQQLESGDGVEGALGDGTGKWRLEVTTDAPLQAMSMLETPTGHLTNLSSIPDNATALTGGQTRHRIPLFPAADDANGGQGFARVVNRDDAEASIQIEAIDDDGTRQGPVTLTAPAGATTHFNSGDLEGGNADRGLPSGTGSGTGEWRLKLTTGADIEALGYIRTPADGFVTSMHDTVRGEEDEDGNHVYEVAIFNPASNTSQVSQLRVINDGSAAAQLTVTGTDDLGVASTDETTVSFTLGAGDARTVTSQQLESGDGVTGALGDGTGKWWLLVRSDRPIELMNLLASQTGHLTNLSTLPGTAAGPDGESDAVHHVPMFPSGADAKGRQGFVRVVSRQDEAATVRIKAFDNSRHDYEAVTLTVGGGSVVHFNSNDLEFGNAGKGLAGSTGAGEGDWRLELTSEADIEVLSYIRRTTDGFLTSMHDLVPGVGNRHQVATFNPGRNVNQVSQLRLINAREAPAQVTIRGLDDAGVSSTAVQASVPAGTARSFTAAELESGAADFEGALGEGVGKWQLIVESDQPVMVMSLLESPTGHLTNLSTFPGTPVDR